MMLVGAPIEQTLQWYGVPGSMSCAMSKTWLAYSRHCVLIRSISHCTFFFSMDPLTNDGSPTCYLQPSKIGHAMCLWLKIMISE